MLRSHYEYALSIMQCVGTFEEAKASVCLALHRWEGAAIDSDALHSEEAVDAHTDLLESKKLELVEVEVDSNSAECDIDKEQGKRVKGLQGRHTNQSALHLPLPPTPATSSMPFILAVLRTHVHLDFRDLKYFHLITVEEILKTYGIEFSI